MEEFVRAEKKGVPVPAKAAPVPTVNNVCIRVTGKQCEDSQQVMLDTWLKDLDVYAYVKRKVENDAIAPAFELLPKDNYGMVNWTKAEADGLISPRDSIDGTEPVGKAEEGFFENIIRLNTVVKFMPDVLFPHGTHSNMISCDSCHPEPFKKEKGANDIKMAEIFEGKWCGKCHGVVAFPVSYPVVEPFNCRRCHLLRKKSEHWKHGSR